MDLLTQNCTIGVMATFEYNVKKWQTQEKTTVCSCQSSDLPESPNIIREKQDFEELVEIKVIDILNKTSNGRTIIQQYKTFQKLPDGCRNILVDIIINYLIQNDIKMSVSLSEKIADQIIMIFPTEIKV